MEFTDIKAPEPDAGVPPWRDPRWLAEAEDWIDAACARAGLARAGQATGRARVYSVVARVPVGGGTGEGIPLLPRPPGAAGHAVRTLAAVLEPDPLGPAR